MKNEIKSVFDELKSEVTRCHYYWIIYRQLFGTNENRIKLINKTNPSVFLIFQNLFLDYITLEISKLTDPPEFKENKNLSLPYLLRILKNEIDNNLYQTLKDLIDALAIKAKIFRDRRNKIVTHKDLVVALDSNANNNFGISRQNVEDALLIIRNFLNKIDGYYFDNETRYEEFITDITDDGTALLINLAKSLAFDDLVDKTLIDYELWEKYGKVYN